MKKIIVGFCLGALVEAWLIAYHNKKVDGYFDKKMDSYDKANEETLVVEGDLKTKKKSTKKAKK